MGFCMREQLNVPRGERYELCRSVHSEANCIISASRKDMIGAVLYLVGKDTKTGELVQNATSCAMCKRLIINAGIEKVIVRDTKDSYRVIEVQKWIDHDDSLTGQMGY
jgi:dCMP deaminase